MKRLCLFLILLLVNHSFGVEGFEGQFQADSNCECAFNVSIFEENNVFKYHLTTVRREVKGKLSILDDESGTYLNFNGLLGDSSSDVVEALLNGDELVFQNTGNAMNPYTHFDECSRKYIVLKRVRN